MGVNWAAGRTKWTAHKQNDQVFPLDHLHPFQVTVALAAYKNFPAQSITVHVGFASHVFTRESKPYDPPEVLYADKREKRAFDEGRYKLSHRLPELIRRLCHSETKCYFGKHNNYFVIETPDQPGLEYRVFFEIERWPQQGNNAVLLVVQSAYADTFDRAPRGSRLKRVQFKVILSHAIKGQRPKPPADR